jgi:hypothetical protein
MRERGMILWILFYFIEKSYFRYCPCPATLVSFLFVSFPAVLHSWFSAQIWADALIFLRRFLSLVLAGLAFFSVIFLSAVVQICSGCSITSGGFAVRSQSCSVWRLWFPWVIFVHRLDSILALPQSARPSVLLFLLQLILWFNCSVH